MKRSTLGRLAELTDMQAAEYMHGREMTRHALADKCRQEGYDGVTITLAYVAGTAALSPEEMSAA